MPVRRLRTRHKALNYCFQAAMACASWAFAGGCSSTKSHADFDLATKRDDAARFVPRSSVHAFYSGHSLTDGIPEVVRSLAQLRGHTFEFEFQSMPGSLIRERTKGAPQGDEFLGYRTGTNANGTNLDVLAEFRDPKSLSPGTRYDVLVVTERHDLPWCALHERSAMYLTHMAKAFLSANPDGAIWLQHSWITLPEDDIEAWLSFEREALPLWECIASQTNRELERDGFPPRVRVLAAGRSLMSLLEALLAGRTPATLEGGVMEQIRFLLPDLVHPSDVGRYFVGLLHYAYLFGESPEGTTAPAGVSESLAAYLQKFAWEEATTYLPYAESAAARPVELCRSYAADVMCPRFIPLLQEDASLMAQLRNMREEWRCRRGYQSDDGPFR